MPAPTFLLVAGYKDAPKHAERDYDPELDAPLPEGSDPAPVPKKRGRTHTTNVGRAGIRIGTDEDGQPLSGGGFSNPVRRRIERVRGNSGFSPAEEAELKQGFAAIAGLVTGHVVPGLSPDEPSDEEIEAAFERHKFVGGPRAKYCRQPSCFKARTDAVHAS